MMIYPGFGALTTQHKVGSFGTLSSAPLAISVVRFERLEFELGAYPSGKARRKVKAQDLWFAILDSQVETGTPYMLYKDACNKKSNQKNLGTIRGSNFAVGSTGAGSVNVSLLGSACDVLFFNDTMVRCQVPVSDAGVYPVTVTSELGAAGFDDSNGVLLFTVARACIVSATSGCVGSSTFFRIDSASARFSSARSSITWHHATSMPCARVGASL